MRLLRFLKCPLVTYVFIALQELRATGKFDVLEFDADEEEHSLEMHLPYVVKIFG